jgi:hypothetical protein
VIEANGGATMSHYGAGLVDELKEVIRSDYEQLKKRDWLPKQFIRVNGRLLEVLY